MAMVIRRSYYPTCAQACVYAWGSVRPCVWVGVSVPCLYRPADLSPCPFRSWSMIRRSVPALLCLLAPPVCSRLFLSVPVSWRNLFRWRSFLASVSVYALPCVRMRERAGVRPCVQVQAYAGRRAQVRPCVQAYVWVYVHRRMQAQAPVCMCVCVRMCGRVCGRVCLCARSRRRFRSFFFRIWSGSGFETAPAENFFSPRKP